MHPLKKVFKIWEPCVFLIFLYVRYFKVKFNWILKKRINLQKSQDSWDFFWHNWRCNVFPFFLVHGGDIWGIFSMAWGHPNDYHHIQDKYQGYLWAKDGHYSLSSLVATACKSWKKGWFFCVFSILHKSGQTYGIFSPI